MKLKKYFMISVVALVSSIFSTANAKETCIPSFLQEEGEYQLTIENKKLWTKVKKIPDNTCWIKVREIFPKGTEEDIPSRRQQAFWININNVSVIKIKKKEV